MLSRRAFHRTSEAHSWEEIWEAGPYYERLAEILEDAEQYAILVGWQIDSRLRLPKPTHPARAFGTLPKETLKAKVLRLCESKPGFEIYFLIWDHAYFYVLERENWQGRIWDEIHPRVHFIFDNRHPLGASHHEKICIVDGRVALCGGIDLCDERWDTPQHLFRDPRRSLDGKREHHEPYHDLAVQVTGSVCAEIQAHVAERWQMLSSIPFPSPMVRPSRAGRGHVVYLSRTVADIERTITREIEFLFRDLVLGAERRIILEGQYYWSREMNDLLIAKIRSMRGASFEVVLILTEIRKLKFLTRQLGPHQLRLLRALEEAAHQSGVKLTIGTPYVLPASSGQRARSVYIHSKVLVIDDRYLGIGSANLAARAFRLDTEVCLTLEGRTDAERLHIRRVGDQILKHWNIRPVFQRAGIHFRRFRPRAELLERRRRGFRIAPAIPWEDFVDPRLPWLYPLKQRYRKILRPRRPPTPLGMLSYLLAKAFTLASVTLAGWALSVSLSILLLRGNAILETKPHWVALYGILLSSTWLLPIPFTGIVYLASIQLGSDAAAGIAIPAIWVASGWAYASTRILPSTSRRYFGVIGSDWLVARIGRRSFSSLSALLFDPRVSMQAKFVYQGLYCVPFPWFALGTWILLPAIYAWFCRCSLAFTPAIVVSWLSRYPGALIAGWLALSLALFSTRLWKRNT